MNNYKINYETNFSFDYFNVNSIRVNILNNWKRSLLVGVNPPSSTNKGDTIKGGLQ
jgi:hypothetical protein